MSIINAIINEQEEIHLKGLLEKAKATNNEHIIRFAKENLFPEYLACGEGYEPAELDKEIIFYYEKVT